MTAYPVESKKSGNQVRNEDIVEQQPFLKNEVEDTAESPPTMRHENETKTGARKSGSIFIIRILCK